MLLVKRRSRMVSIRLSDQEYERLRSACVEAGARSVSDVARDALRVVLGRENPVETELITLHDRMNQLDREVKRLAQIVERG